eukprot:5405249-Amphidinium_carterae.1
MLDAGCERGRRCNLSHPNKPGKCFICGSKSHGAKECPRPRMADQVPPKAAAKAAAGSETAPPTGKAAAPAPKRGAPGRNRSRRSGARVSFAEQPE